MLNEATRLLRPPRPDGSSRQPTSILSSGSSYGSKTEPSTGSRSLLPIEFYAGAPYRIECELAAGGMGIVYLAFDERLKRDVAIKVLNEDYLTNPEAVQRFVEEAQIAGQLQHPCIPPIHEIGTLPDGRPFLAMKLIQGRTLAEILAERDRPSDAWPRDFAVFEQICQALAYAHNRAVIHRDLKPSNVMVGSFGEVQVMDWGLAKVLGGKYDADSVPTPDPVRVRDDRLSTHGTETIVGSMLGTPTFMPPEQARGEKSRIDARADVFGLGAILCVILTGKPPYEGKSIDSVRRQASEGDTACCDQRLGQSGADPAWIALARDCLKGDPRERPADAAVVARRVADLRTQAEERRRQAELDKARAEVHVQEERKRRSVQVLLAASIALLAIVASVAFWWSSRIWQERETSAQLQRIGKQNSRREAEVSLRFALSHASDLTAKSLWTQAKALLERERRALESIADPELTAELDAARSRLDFLAEMDDIRIGKVVWKQGGFSAPEANARYRMLFLRMGFAIETTEPVALAAAAERLGTRTEVRDALDGWFNDERDGAVRRKLWETAKLLSDDPLRETEALFQSDIEPLRKLADSLIKEKANPAFYQVVGEAILRRGELDVRPMLERACGLYPGNFWLHMSLAGAYWEAYGDPDKAAREYRAALAVRPDCYAALVNLGAIACAQGQYETAWDCMDRASQLDPGSDLAVHNKGVILRNQNRLDEALEWYRKALEINPANAEARFQIGDIASSRGQVEAFSHFEKALQLRPDYPEPYIAMHKWYWDRSQWGLALLYARKAAECGGRLEYLARQKAMSTLRKMREFESAVSEGRELIRILPNSHNHNMVGTILRDDLKRSAEARGHFEQAVRIDPKDSAPWFNMGLTLLDESRHSEAVRAFAKAVETGPAQASSHFRYAEALLLSGDKPRALLAAAKAVEVSQGSAYFVMLLGDCQDAAGRPSEAFESYRQAAAGLKGESPPARPGEVPVHARNIASVERLRELVKLFPTRGDFQFQLGMCLAETDPGGALELLRQAVRLQPRNMQFARGLEAIETRSNNR